MSIFPKEPLSGKTLTAAIVDELADCSIDELGPVQPQQVHLPPPIIGNSTPGEREVVRKFYENGFDKPKRKFSAEEIAKHFAVPAPPLAPATAADILDVMAATFRERQQTYGSNYRMVAPIMAILFPNGLPPNLAFQDKFHLFELIIVKLSRFAISELSHDDSIHDAGVYCAMVEACVLEEKKCKS